MATYLAIVLSACLCAVFADTSSVTTSTTPQQSYGPDPADYVYPCAKSENKDTCVGEFLAKHSTCDNKNLWPASKVDPYQSKYTRVDGIYFNITGAWQNVLISGLSDSSLVDFYYNQKTKKAVLTMNFRNYSEAGDYTIQVLDIGNEVISFTTSYTLYFTDVTITTIFKDYEQLSFKKSISFGYLPSNPTNNHGASHGDDVLALAKKYPAVKDVITQFDLHRDVVAMEGFQYRAPRTARVFINSKLCKFNEIV